MGATLGGVHLTIDPSEVRWDYKVKVGSTKTVGGKVTQLLGVEMGDLIVKGQYGNYAKNRQDFFFRQIEELADAQVPKIGSPPPAPVRFHWPEQKWDFYVYIKSLTQDGAGVSVERRPGLVDIRYTLTLFVFEDNSGIVKAVQNSAQVKYLQRITAGMGWAQTDWNGPMTIREIEAALAGQSVFDYLFQPPPQTDDRFPDLPAPPTPVGSDIAPVAE